MTASARYCGVRHAGRSGSNSSGRWRSWPEDGNLRSEHFGRWQRSKGAPDVRAWHGLPVSPMNHRSSSLAAAKG